MTNLLTMKGIAELLNVSIPTIRKWLRDEKLPHIRVGSTYRFDPIQIRQWIKEKSVEAKSIPTILTKLDK